MTSKSKILINSFLKSLPLNPNKERNFVTYLKIETQDSIDFEYFIGIQNEYDINPTYSRAHKTLELNIRRYQDLPVKYHEIFVRSLNDAISFADITIKCEELITDRSFDILKDEKLTTLTQVQDPRFKSPIIKLENQPDTSSYIMHAEDPAATVPWYKNPINIGIAIVIILIIATFIMKNRKETISGGSLFVD